MKITFTKALSLFLCAIILIGTLSVGVFAAQDSINVTNLFDYTKAVQYDKYIWHQYSEFIEVKEGDELYFGPCFPNQGFHVACFNSSKSDLNKYLGGSVMSVVDTFPNGLVIYKWKVPAGTAYVRVANSTTINRVFMITKNEPFNCETFYTYWTFKNFDPDSYVSGGHTNPVSADKISNLFDLTKCKSGAYNEAGQLLSGDYLTTDLIPVTKGDVLYFGKTALMDGFQLKTFDSSKKQIQGKIQSPDCKTVDFMKTDSTVILSYDIPDGVAYVAASCKGAYKNSYVLTKNQPFNEEVLSAYLGKNTTQPQNPKYPVKENSPLKGIKVGFYGDSISAAGVDKGTAYEYVRGWAGRIGVTNDMKWANHSVSAYSISNCRGEKTIMAQFKSSIKFNYDMIILHGGTNDAWDGAPVGTMTEGFGASDSYDVSTFAGGLEQIFAYIREKNPDAIVGYVINFKFINANKGKVIKYKDDAGKTHSVYLLNKMDEYVEMTKKICDKWGVKYVDLFSDDELTAKLHPSTTTADGKTVYQNTYLSDYIHPTSAGYDIIYPYIEEFMIDLVTPDPDPVPDPEVTTDAPEVTAPVTQHVNKKENGGCKSFGGTSVALISVIALAGATVISKKKRA